MYCRHRRYHSNGDGIITFIVLRNLQNEKVHSAVELLPEVQKRRIKMYFFEGMTYEEIAVRENCKHPAVVKSVKAALEKLRIYLEE